MSPVAFLVVTGIVGVVTGISAGKTMPLSSSHGKPIDIGAGIIGSLIGGLVGLAVTLAPESQWVAVLFGAIFAAFLLLSVVRIFLGTMPNGVTRKL